MLLEREAIILTGSVGYKNILNRSNPIRDYHNAAVIIPF